MLHFSDKPRFNVCFSWGIRVSLVEAYDIIIVFSHLFQSKTAYQNFRLEVSDKRTPFFGRWWSSIVLTGFWVSKKENGGTLLHSSGNSKIILRLVFRGHSALISQLVASCSSGIVCMRRSISSEKAYIVFEKGIFCALPPLRHGQSTGRLRSIVFLGTRTDGHPEGCMSVLSRV